MQSCVVFLNGEYWGLYEMTEKLSDDFIKSNYDIPKENVAMIKNGALEEGSQTELNNFYQFFKKYAAADLTNEDNYQAVEDFVDAEELVKTGRLEDKLSVELLIIKYSSKVSTAN